MKKRVLIVVDYQKDFVNGVLAVPGAETIAQNIQREVEKDYFKKVFTFDTHTAADYETSEEKTLFPNIHCEFNKDGWFLHEIDTIPYQIVKGSVAFLERPFQKIEIDNQLFFCKDKFNIFEGNRMFENWIISNFNNSEVEFVVCGVALNYCVFYQAMELADRGYAVIIKNDCVKGIMDDTYEKNIEIMKQNNIRFED